MLSLVCTQSILYVFTIKVCSKFFQLIIPVLSSSIIKNVGTISNNQVDIKLN